MSNEALTWAFKQDGLPSSAKFVLVVLADKANQSHRCFPGQKMIAEMTGQTDRSVRRQMVILEEAGLLRRVPRYGDDGYRTSDEYELPVNGPFEATTGQNVHQSLPDIDDRLPDKNAGLTGQDVRAVTQSNPKKNPKRDARKRETEFPEGFTFADVREWTRSGNFNLTADDFEHFRAHHEAKGSKFRDWRKAWQTWAHNSRKFDKPVTAGAAERPDWMNGWM